MSEDLKFFITFAFLMMIYVSVRDIRNDMKKRKYDDRD